MTIFFEIVSGFLQEKIKEFKEDSLAADKNERNRNLLLSADKQKLLDELSRDISQLDNKDTDEKNYTALTELIVKYSEINADATLPKGYSEGTFGSNMDLLKNVTKRLYTKMKPDLLNIAHDTKPLSSFCYYASAYFFDHIISSLNPSLARHPMLSQSPDLTFAKEALVLKAIGSCIRKLGGVKNDSPYSDEIVHDLVSYSIEKLREANLKTCKAFSNGIKFLFQPSLGNLEKQMKLALNEIEKNATFNNKDQEAKRDDDGNDHTKNNMVGCG